MLAHQQDLVRNLNETEPLLMLLSTAEPFLQKQVKMSALKKRSIEMLRDMFIAAVGEGWGIIYLFSPACRHIQTGKCLTFSSLVPQQFKIA